MARIWCAVCAFICVAVSSAAHSSEVRIGTPEQKDSFIETLLSSKELRAAGINLVQMPFKKEHDVLGATIQGSVDVGLFPLASLDLHDIGDSLRLYTAFTRPFFFRSGDEIFSTEDTALGDAVLADLRRANIFPLKFWNRGFTKIVARNPINSARDFQRLKVADTGASAAATPVLMSLGAEPTRLQRGNSASDAITHGLAKAMIVDPPSNDASDWHDLVEIQGQLFSTDFEPIVGILAASNQYWEGLSERERQAWKRAVDEASLISRKEMKEHDLVASRFTKIRPIMLRDKERHKLIDSMAVSDSVSKIKEDLQTVEHAKSKAQISENIKKKN